jgi:hypothetical protein
MASSLGPSAVRAFVASLPVAMVTIVIAAFMMGPI